MSYFFLTDSPKSEENQIIILTDEEKRGEKSSQLRSLKGNFEHFFLEQNKQLTDVFFCF